MPIKPENVTIPIKHDELAQDLAMHLLTPARMVWTDMQLGPSGSARPDVYTIDKSFAHPRAMTYEVKVSVADFRADVTAGKWQSYLAFSSGVYFAAPAGLLKREDVPRGCGLIVRGPDGWRTLRAPTLQPFRMTSDCCLKLLIDGRDNEVRPTARRERTTWGAAEKIAKRWGAETAKLLGDVELLRVAAETYRNQVEEHKERIGDVDVHIRRQVERLTSHWLDEFCRHLAMPRGDMGDIAKRMVELRKIAMKERGWSRSNVEAAQHALEQELERVKQLRVVLGEAAEVPA